MSSYGIKAIRKDDDARVVVDVDAIDDYFGNHEYGYRVDGVIYAKDKFDEEFDEVKV